MAQSATISSKGQLVIPARLRKKYNLSPRSKVVFGEHNGRLTLEPAALDQVLALRGCLGHLGEDVETWWIQEKQRERERENAKLEEKW